MRATFFLVTLWILVHVLSAHAAGKQPFHTETFERWKNGAFTETMFLPDTYLPFALFDRVDLATIGCHKLPDDQEDLRAEYIRLLTQNDVGCTGSWCIGGGFSCSGATSSKLCYQVEHIIDQQTTDPQLDRYEKNIVGNVVMAFGLWNSQMGNKKWDIVQEEKKRVYTQAMFSTARHFVVTCGSGNSAGGDAEDQTNEQNEAHGFSALQIAIGIGVIFVISAIIIVGIVATCVRKWRDSRLQVNEHGAGDDCEDDDGQAVEHVYGELSRDDM